MPGCWTIKPCGWGEILFSHQTMVETIAFIGDFRWRNGFVQPQNQWTPTIQDQILLCPWALPSSFRGVVLGPNLSPTPKITTHQTSNLYIQIKTLFSTDIHDPDFNLLLALLGPHMVSLPVKGAGSKPKKATNFQLTGHEPQERVTTCATTSSSLAKD